MTLLQKIRDLRKAHKLASAIADGAALFSTANIGAAALDQLTDTQLVAEAKADFYSGCRGPKQFQLDQRLSFDGEKVNYTLLPKVFVDLNKKAGLFGVIPFNYSPSDLPSLGVGVGGYYSLGNINFFGVLPVVYNAEGDTTNINPTIYATIMADDFLIDPRINYLASLSDAGTSHSLGFGLTIGYKIDNVILGLDVESSIDLENPTEEQLKKNLNYQGILRIDLDPEHNNWVQAYLGPKAVGIGFRANFDWK